MNNTQESHKQRLTHVYLSECCLLAKLLLQAWIIIVSASFLSLGVYLVWSSWAKWGLAIEFPFRRYFSCCRNISLLGNFWWLAEVLGLLTSVLMLPAKNRNVILCVWSPDFSWCPETQCCLCLLAYLLTQGHFFVSSFQAWIFLCSQTEMYFWLKSTAGRTISCRVYF